jgi:hypothetical protein
MKTLITLSLFTVACFAQGTTGQLCWTPDKATPAKTICKDYPPAAKKVIRDFIDSQTTPAVAPETVPTPKYKGIADLIFSHMAALVDESAKRFPTAQIASDEATAKTALDSAEAKRRALIDRTPATEPQ